MIILIVWTIVVIWSLVDAITNDVMNRNIVAGTLPFLVSRWIYMIEKANQLEREK